MENNEWVVLKEKGNEEFRNKNYNAAISLYTDAIEINPNEETLYGNRSNCYKAIGKLKMAKLDLNKALELNPKNTKNLKRLANIYISLGNLGSAEQLLQKCKNLEPKDSTHIVDLNKVTVLIKDWDDLNENFSNQKSEKAEEIASKMLKDCTDYSQLKLLYIQSLLNNVKISEAIQFLSSKLNNEEKFEDEFQYLTVLALYYDGQYEKAKKILQNLLSKVNDNEKYNQLFRRLKEIEKQKDGANELFKACKYDEAIEAYTKLLEFDPSNRNFNSTILANRALCYQKQNKLKEALRDINKALSLNEKYWKAYFRRGNIYMGLNMYEEAKYDFQKVKDNDPSNKDVHKLLEDSKKEEKKAKKRDYYKILDLDRNASSDDIRKAYKKLALKWHPDRNSESEESQKMAEKMFKDINDAYVVLSDAKKKQMYDNGYDPLNPEEGGSGMDGSGMHFGGDPNEIFNMFFGGGGGPEIIFNMGGGGGFPGGFRTSRGGNQQRRSNARGRGGGDPFSFFFQ